MESKNFTVAIVGGGIGGLTLAIGLLQRNISVQIYEAAPAFKEVGLGLSIGPAAYRAMPLIDPQIQHMYDSLITTHADSPGYEQFRETWFEVVWATDHDDDDHDDQKSGQVLMDLKALPTGQTTVRRADFLDSLVSLIPPETTNFGKRLVYLHETTTNGVELRFEDDTTATADLVVGCDGIKSRVKQAIIPPGEYQQVLPRYSGMYGYPLSWIWTRWCRLWVIVGPACRPCMLEKARMGSHIPSCMRRWLMSGCTSSMTGGRTMPGCIRLVRTTCGGTLGTWETM